MAPIDGASIDIEMEIIHGEQHRVSCLPGFSGDSVAYTQMNGELSGEITCEPNRCEPLTILNQLKIERENRVMTSLPKEG